MIEVPLEHNRISASELSFTPRRRVLIFLSLSVAIPVISLFAAYFIQDYYLKLYCEAVAATYLIGLTTVIWLLNIRLIYRLLAALFVLICVFGSFRFVFAESFAAWFEVALWYIPIASLFCAGLRLAGYRIAESHTQELNFTYSIRSLMLATTAVAVLIPLFAWLAASRAAGQFDSYLWLTDALVLVCPISLISIGIVSTVLSNRLFHTITLLPSAAILGLVIFQVYGRNDIWNGLQLLTITACLTCMLTCFVRIAGFQLVNLKQQYPQSV